MSEQYVSSPRDLSQPGATRAVSTARPRLLYIDNIRVCLISLVIVGHMAITYGAPLGDWYYNEPGDVGTIFSIITILLLGIGASFLLGLFFMIAGYFSPSPLDRKGSKTFILERFIRLGIPLVLYALVINPLVTYWAAVQGGYEGSLIQYVPSHLPNLSQASIGPLWFVEALLVISIVYALIQPLLGAKSASTSKPTTLSVPGNTSIFLFALGLGLLTFLVRIWAPYGWWWEPIHQEPGHFPQYLALFAVGTIAYRHNWFSLIPTSQAKIWGWAALGLVPGFPILAVAAGALKGEFDPAIAGGITWLSLFYSLWESFIGVSLVVAVLVWFRNRFNHQGRLAQNMSAAAYAVYILHPLIIVPMALWLSFLKLELELKFVLVTPLAIVLCFLMGHLVRLLPVVRKII